MALFAFDMESLACGMLWKNLEHKLTMYKIGWMDFHAEPASPIPPN